MGLKALIKKIPGVNPLICFAKDKLQDIRAAKAFLTERNIPRTSPIRVGFICQYIPVWHKLQPIYEAMREDPHFAPYIICVPSNIENSQLVGNDLGRNDTYEYFTANGYRESLNSLQPDGSWLPLESLQLSYIFYPRPYDSCMPECYHSNRVCHYCKICLILYGMNTTKEIVSVTLHKDFFRHVYCYFAELPYSMEYNQQQNRWLHRLGLQQSVYYGMPGIEGILSSKNASSPAWDFSKNGFRIMWTPRWTTDPALGGSNFFTYYQHLIRYAEENSDADLLFRPHPLALQHFLRTGEMTQQDVDQFQHACSTISNLSLDQQKEYAATFWNTDVLISDISGLIPEYFVTGKPLIYCASNMSLTPEETTQQIIDGSYVVHNWEQLQSCLDMLKRGKDPLAEKRAQIVKELYCDELCHPTQHIVEHLAQPSK